MDWKSYLPGVLGWVVFIVTAELFPDRSRFLLGILDACVFIVTYYILPKKLEMWQRILISAVVTIIIVCIFRFVFDFY